VQARVADRRDLDLLEAVLADRVESEEGEEEVGLDALPERVICAAGVWSRELAATAGVELPIERDGGCSSPKRLLSSRADSR
jgi:glycine/D-amino acid oxidase-like deaminating enzyme